MANYKSGHEKSDRRPSNSDAEIISKLSLFEKSSIPKDSQDILENFDSIVQSVRPLNS